MADRCVPIAREDTIARVVALPCFVRRSLGCLDPDHKLLLLQMALLSKNGESLHLVHETSRTLRTQTSFTTTRFSSALRRLERGGFIEIAGAVTTDKFSVYLAGDFE